VRSELTEEHHEFIRLLEPIRDRMARIVWRVLRDPNDADDALQDALATIWKQWSKVRLHQNPQALVMRICNDSAYDGLRRSLRRRRREGRLPLLRDAIDTGSTPVQAVAHIEELARIQRAISRLSKNQSSAILLRALDGLSYREIGEALNCGEATARKHAARARERLRAALSLTASAGSKDASDE
jgi:RNA polymerase sigma-70 factor (ECF subfamily)